MPLVKMLAGAAAALSAVLALSAPSSGQAPPASPVMAHYRAYTSALAAGDLPAAENAAAAALVASEARDGDGGRTAVFALNLATVRLMRGSHAEALAPARRARALADNPATGVHPQLADLIVGRIALALNEPNAPDQLATALRQVAPGGPAPTDEISAAAVALGTWASTNQNYTLAREAWAIAAAFPEGTGAEATYARANAHIQLGASIFKQEVGPRGREMIDREAAAEAHRAFHQAKLALAPLAEVELAGGQMTFAQRAYAEAITWDAVLRGKAGRRFPREPGEAEGDADGITELGPVAGSDSRPRCLVGMRKVTGLHYPEEAVEKNQIGAVGVRFRLNEGGEAEEAQVVVNLGSPVFAEAVGDVRRWRFERRPDSPAKTVEWR